MTYTFEPPTHEEGIRTDIRPLNYYRLTYANSIVRVGGTLTSVRSPSVEQLEGLEEGTDFFRGGRVYEVTDAIANELEIGGFIPNTHGYGLGPYGYGPYGD